MSPTGDDTRPEWLERIPEWAGRRLGFLVGSDFVRKVAETFVTRIALILIGLITSVLIARMLGPEGRGLQATVAAIAALGVQFGNLGLHSSNTYYVAKDSRLLPVLTGNSLALSFGGAGALTVAAYFVTRVYPDIVPLDGVLLALALGAIPVGLAYLLLQNLLLGTNKIREYNRIELLTKVLMVLLLAGLLASDLVSVVAVSAIGLAVSCVGVAWTLVGLLRGMGSRLSVSARALIDHMGYGFKAYVAALFAYTVLRADVLLCGYILGEAPTGYYSIAVSMADLVYMLPVVAGTIAFPRLTATVDPADRWAKAFSVAKWVAVIMLVVAAVSALLARPAVALLYGQDYLPAVAAFLWLLPGIVILGVNTILMNYFAAEGMPPIAIWSPAAASVMNIGLNIVLLPRMGIVGASIASSVAYALMFAMSAVYLHRTREAGVV